MVKESRNPFLRHENKWVAMDLAKNRVVASAKSLGELEGKLRIYALASSKITLVRVPSFDKAYAPAGQI